MAVIAIAVTTIAVTTIAVTTIAEKRWPENNGQKKCAKIDNLRIC
jgi:hypothetical protein